MVFDATKCGRKTIHLQAKDTGKHSVRLMTCNKLDCPNCRPIISARIKKKIRYYAQHEKLLFFNTITSKNGFEDLDNIFQRIRKELTFNFTIEGYMKRKKVDYAKALKWYEKKREKLIQTDMLSEIKKISKYEAIITVAKIKNVFYQGMTEDEKYIYKKQNKKLIEKTYQTHLNNNLKNEKLKENLYNKILQRFLVNEHEDFKFIRVIEFHVNGEPHFHFLSNKYISHTLLKSVTTEGISEIYDNTYIVEDAMKKNPTLDVNAVDTDIVANYVSKITNYITKDTLEAMSSLRNGKGSNKKLISSSDSIKIFDNKDDEESKYKNLGVYDFVLNASNYEVPYWVSNVGNFIKERSVRSVDSSSVELVQRAAQYFSNDVERYNYIIAERLKAIFHATNEMSLKTVIELDNLTQEQNDLIRYFKDSRISLLIGRAGTGKSFTITSLLKSLQPNPNKTFILTYTGKASTRLKELLNNVGLDKYKPVTIHKACSSNFNSQFLKNEENNLDCDYLIIDEVSMIPREILAKLLLAVPTHTKILFAGDDAQLPPINDISIISELRMNMYVKTIELTKNFRSDDFVLSYAHRVLKRQMIDFNKYEDTLNDIVLGLVANGYQILTNTKKMTKEINRIVQNGKKDIVRCFNDFKYNINDKVMIVANSTPRNVSNGDTGTIISFDDKGIGIQLDHEDRQVFYRYEDTEEVVPAYAFTIHKSQGSEYEKVAIILENQNQLNTNNLLYTAITRAKKDVKIFVPSSQVIEWSLVNYPSSNNNITINNIYRLITSDVS